MNPWLLAPPIAFLVIFALAAGLMVASKRLAITPSSNPPGKFKPYACGEDVQHHRMQPDYSLFFPFAFAFTLLHVVALVVALGTGLHGQVLGLAVLYLFTAGIGLTLLLRR